MLQPERSKTPTLYVYMYLYALYIQHTCPHNPMFAVLSGLDDCDGIIGFYWCSGVPLGPLVSGSLTLVSLCISSFHGGQSATDYS